MGQQIHKRSLFSGCGESCAIVGVVIASLFVLPIAVKCGQDGGIKGSWEKAKREVAREKELARRETLESLFVGDKWQRRNRAEKRAIINEELETLLEKRGMVNPWGVAAVTMSDVVECIDEEGAARTYRGFIKQIERCYDKIAEEE